MVVNKRVPLDFGLLNISISFQELIDVVFRAVQPLEELRVLLFELLEVTKVKVDWPLIQESVLHIRRAMVLQYVLLLLELNLFQSHFVLKFGSFNLCQPLSSFS